MPIIRVEKTQSEQSFDQNFRVQKEKGKACPALCLFLLPCAQGHPTQKQTGVDEFVAYPPPKNQVGSLESTKGFPPLAPVLAGHQAVVEVPPDQRAELGGSPDWTKPEAATDVFFFSEPFAPLLWTSKSGRRKRRPPINGNVWREHPVTAALPWQRADDLVSWYPLLWWRQREAKKKKHPF